MPTPPKNRPVPAFYYLVKVTTIKGPEVRPYKGRSMADVLSRVRAMAILEVTNIREVTHDTYLRHGGGA